MTIICFEGASAVGKSTLSAYLEQNYHALVIPEVNKLFERPADEQPLWYFERQIDRWQLAVNAQQDHRYIVLDGDCFQPLWYNWSYDFAVCHNQPLQTISAFYRARLERNEIAFPDKYFILSTSSLELRKRKVQDISRQRKNFEWHLKFIRPQIAYFNMIKSLDNRLVEFIENSSVQASCELAVELAGTINAPAQYDPLGLFDAIVGWLQGHKATEFKPQRHRV